MDTVCSTMAFTCASSDTSQRMAMALWPAATSCSVAVRAAVSLTSARATAAPSAANACAAANPIPEAAPVTSATLFSKDKFINSIPFLSIYLPRRASDDSVDIEQNIPSMSAPYRPTSFA